MLKGDKININSYVYTIEDIKPNRVLISWIENEVRRELWLIMSMSQFSSKVFSKKSDKYLNKGVA